MPRNAIADQVLSCDYVHSNARDRLKHSHTV